MRLICPNCGAQYEVQNDVIPESGRDVQCSNCGHTWFQEPASALEESEFEDVTGPPRDETAEEAEETAQAAEEAEQPPTASDVGKELTAEVMREAGDVLPEESQPEQAATQEAHPDEEAPESDRAEEELAQEGQPEETPPEATQLDEAVLGILREEAEIEIEARMGDAGNDLEIQTDLGLEEGVDDADHRARAVQERTARLRGIEPEEPDSLHTRSDLLPDIEEINSTLRATSDRQEEGAPAEEPPIVRARKRRGARLGLALAVLIAAVALLAYVYAPVIIDKLPQSKTYLTAYVDQVNSLRLWIDGLMKQATATISGTQTAPDAAGTTPPVQN